MMPFRFFPLVVALLPLVGCVKNAVSAGPSEEMKPQPPPKERVLILEKKAVIEEEAVGDFKYHSLIIGKGDSEKSMMWPYSAPEPGKIPSARVLRMEVVEVTRYPLGFSNQPMFTYELSKMTDGSRVLFDASVCKVHDRKMARKVVPISYGLPYFPPDAAAAGETFPNDGQVLGGCAVDPSETHRRRWVCATCEARSKAWWEKNLPKR